MDICGIGGIEVVPNGQVDALNTPLRGKRVVKVDCGTAKPIAVRDEMSSCINTPILRVLVAHGQIGTHRSAGRPEGELAAADEVESANASLFQGQRRGGAARAKGLWRAAAAAAEGELTRETHAGLPERAADRM